MLVIIIIILAVALAYCFSKLRMLSIKMAETRKENIMMRTFLDKFDQEVNVHLENVKKLAKMVAEDGLYLSKTEKRSISAQILYNSSLISTLLEECVLVTHEERGHAMEKESFCPNIICQKCIDSIQLERNTNPNVKITFKRTLSDSFFVSSDTHLVELILAKLLWNSCRFTEKGEITVSCDTNETKDTITFCVQNPCGGIPEGREDKLFTWFDNPEDCNDEAEIDLSVAQRMAMKLGGILHIDDTYKEGMKIQLILPI
ncbi:MAG: ATP-binding protein [Prevotella sp.]